VIKKHSGKVENYLFIKTTKIPAATRKKYCAWLTLWGFFYIKVYVHHSHAKNLAIRQHKPVA